MAPPRPADPPAPTAARCAEVAAVKVDVAPVRAHVIALCEEGAAPAGISEVSGVSGRLVGRLTRPFDQDGARPLSLIDQRYADAILAVTLEQALAATTPAARARYLQDVHRRTRRDQAADPVALRPRTRREAVGCVVDLAGIHALPLDCFIARQLDVSIGAARDLLREARRDGLLPNTVRARR